MGLLARIASKLAPTDASAFLLVISPEVLSAQVVQRATCNWDIAFF
jgi:hypothetical protein